MAPAPALDAASEMPRIAFAPSLPLLGVPSMASAECVCGLSDGVREHAEALRRHLAAETLELWQEAFRSVEDIHGLMTLVKKSPKPQLMAVYYAKLTKIFWKSENNLYHAYAWYKLYNLSKSYKKDFAAEDLKLMASAVVLSTLAVPPYDRKHGAAHFELELEKDRNLQIGRAHV